MTPGEYFGDLLIMAVAECRTRREDPKDLDDVPPYLWIPGMIIVAALVGFLIIHLIRSPGG
jgi:hypothetical protein